MKGGERSNIEGKCKVRKNVHSRDENVRLYYIQKWAATTVQHTTQYLMYL
jgi:hypothetical protein